VLVAVPLPAVWIAKPVVDDTVAIVIDSVTLVLRRDALTKLSVAAGLLAHAIVFVVVGIGNGARPQEVVVWPAKAGACGQCALLLLSIAGVAVRALGSEGRLVAAVTSTEPPPFVLNACVAYGVVTIGVLTAWLTQTACKRQTGVGSDQGVSLHTLCDNALRSSLYDLTCGGLRQRKAFAAVIAAHAAIGNVSVQSLTINKVFVDGVVTVIVDEVAQLVLRCVDLTHPAGFAFAEGHTGTHAQVIGSLAWLSAWQVVVYDCVAVVVDTVAQLWRR